MNTAHKTKWTVITLTGMRLLFEHYTDVHNWILGYGGYIINPRNIDHA